MSNSHHIELESTGTGEEGSNSLLANTRCSFCFPCFGSHRSTNVGLDWWERVRTTSWSHAQAYPSAVTGDRWWSRGLRTFAKLREWSEIVAGPRWKTFIRRFNRNRSGGFKHMCKYQYDPLSYALNFDEGPGQNGDFEDESFRNFSTRYAVGPLVKLDAGQDVTVLA